MERSIEASTTVRAAPARVRQVLLDDPGSVLGDACSPDDRRARRFRAQLGAAFRGGASVHQEIEVQLGAPRPVDGGGVALALTWRATGHDRLVPAFQGELRASPDRAGTLLSLHGTYTVPLGPIGRFGEAVGWRRMARRSLSAFVADVARRLDAEVDRRLEVMPSQQAHTVVVHEHIGSEHYVG